MSPSPEYESKKIEAEANLIADKVSNLSSSEKDAIFQQGLELEKAQSCPSNVSCLPTLTMADLNKEPEPYIVQDRSIIRAIPLQLCPQPTNGVTHFRALIDLSEVDRTLRSNYVPLFVAIATEMGTKRQDYRQFDRKIQLATSGLGISHHIHESPHETRTFMDAIILSSVCLDRNVPEMFALWQELLSAPCYQDKERLETLIRATASDLANGVAYSGHRYAMASASSRLSLASKYRERDSGLQFIRKMKHFAAAKSEQMQDILSNLQIVAELVFASNIRIALNLTPIDEHIDSTCNHLETSLSMLRNASFSDVYKDNVTLQRYGSISSRHHVLPVPVGYLARSIGTNVAYTHKDYAALRVAAQLLTARYLHPEVRERGGAYGSGAIMNPSGILSLFSYRDPEASHRTIQVFDGAAAWLGDSKNYTAKQIEEAKLSIFQKIDAPMAPGDKAMSKFLQNIDRNCLQNHRMALCSVEPMDMITMCRKYLDTTSGRLAVANTLIGPPSKNLDESWEVIND